MILNEIQNVIFNKNEIKIIILLKLNKNENFSGWLRF